VTGSRPRRGTVQPKSMVAPGRLGSRDGRYSKEENHDQEGFGHSVHTGKSRPTQRKKKKIDLG
jgi:hypothetical protein